MIRARAVFLFALLFGGALLAEPEASPSPAKTEAAPSPAKEVKPKESKGSAQIGGHKIDYVVKTGTLPVLKDDGTTRANVFFVYYAVPDKTGQRPITFCFNGGPGSSAVWLHLGGLGPKIVALPPDGKAPVPLAKIVDNPNSILDVSDLVFVDPVATGFSRAAKGEKPEQFFGVDEDIQAAGEFVRLFTTREKRWSSPKFLCGESYGGIRVAGLAQYLQDEHGMNFSGLIFLSALLNFQTLNENTGNDLPNVLALPTLTAVAFYHHKLAPDLAADFDKTIAAAQTFARGAYAAALLPGRTLDAATRAQIAGQVAHFTGLTAAQVEACNLRVPLSIFRGLLLAPEKKILGRFDGRVTADDIEHITNLPDFDPSLSNVLGAFSAAVNSYVTNELGYESDVPYRVLVPLDWHYTSYANRYVSMEDSLADTMKENPLLRVLVLQSKYDLAVPPATMRYSFDHLAIPDSLRPNIQFSSFDSGHMMYLNQPDAAKLRQELTAFIQPAK